MSNKILLESEDNFVTDIGAAFVGDRAVFKGKDLHKDLKYCSWMEVFLYGITDRFFSAAEIKLINSLWSYTSYPDPRLWNNRAAALAGTARSTKAAGVSASISLCEAKLYGAGSCVKGIDFLQRAFASVEQGVSLREFVKQEIKRYRVIYGYGRPIKNATDERVAPTLELMSELGIARGPYVELAFAIEKVLPRQKMNMAALGGAIAADLGFTASQFHSFTIFCTVGGVLPCLDEALKKPEGSFFPLRSNSIAYEGVERRTWDK